MLKTKEVTINDKRFLITQFMAREGLKLQFKLIKYLSPIVATILNSLEIEDDKLVNIDSKAIAMALANNIDENACFDLVMRLLSSTKMNNQDIKETDFDFAFAGDYRTLYELLYQVIDFNYGNFFGDGGIGNLIKKENPPAIEPSSTKVV